MLQVAPAPQSPGHWGSVKLALIKSIREGVFFDKKYWARHSKGGHALKPVYFSGAIMSDKAQQLNKRASKPCYRFAQVLIWIPVVKYIKAKNPLKSDLEEDIDIESDYEGESLGVADELSNAEEEKEEQTRAILITGSFATYVLFFILPLHQGE